MASGKNKKSGKVTNQWVNNKIKEQKETIMILKAKAVIIDGKVDGKEIIAEKRWYGKDYLVLKNV